MGDITKTGRLYFGDNFLCTVSPLEIPTISAVPTSEIEERAKDYVTTFAPQNITFTCMNRIKMPKSFRRIPVCKSRKHFIKKMMAIGYKRNMAVAIADMVKQFGGETSYQSAWRKIANSAYIQISDAKGGSEL